MAETSCESSSLSSSSSMKNSIQIRQVYYHNLHSEFSLIFHLLPSFPIVSFDTEFPGNIHGVYNPRADPDEVYHRLKKNVDATQIIQIGFTLSNPQGDLPEVDSHPAVWQFHFKDFNLQRGDANNPDSIDLLKKNGIDFEKNAQRGIDSAVFAGLLVKYRIVGNPNVTWIGFHSCYDLAYMIKILISKEELPGTPSSFLMLVRHFFGVNVYDLKCVAKCNGLHGGLENIASTLGVERKVGTCHQAGSDSLLTMHVYMALRLMVNKDDEIFSRAYSGKLCGLEGVRLLPPVPVACRDGGVQAGAVKIIQYPPPLVLRTCRPQPGIQVPHPIILGRRLPQLFNAHPPPVILSKQ